MTKVSQQKQNPNNNGNKNNSNVINGVATKVKRTRRSVPRDSPPQRSSIYRGVTRHRWTGRYEAHLWDKNCWNESQNKKGRQVYLGAYDDEEAAAHAYDLAALKYWGAETILNFPLTTYEKEMKEMDDQSREEYIGSLRRKSSGFSRGVSKYRGVARHHHNGRWEARIGRVFGNKYLYLGTYATQEEAATAYDMAAIEYRGLNAVTNFDLSRYIKWLRPNKTINTSNNILLDPQNPNNTMEDTCHTPAIIPDQLGFTTIPLKTSQVSTSPTNSHETLTNTNITTLKTLQQPFKSLNNTSSALGLLFKSSKFKEMMEMSLSHVESESPLTLVDELSMSKCSFPDDIQTYFESHDDSNGYEDCEEDDQFMFGGLNSMVAPMFHCEFEDEIKDFIA